MSTERSRHSGASRAREGFVDGLGRSLGDIERSAGSDLEGMGLGDRLMDAATEPSSAAAPHDPHGPQGSEDLVAQAQLEAFRASCKDRGTAVHEEPSEHQRDENDEVRMPRRQGHRHRRPAKGRR